MTDLILRHFRNRKKLEQMLSDEREKMFAVQKPIAKKEGGESPTSKISNKRKKGNT